MQNQKHYETEDVRGMPRTFNNIGRQDEGSRGRGISSSTPKGAAKTLLLYGKEKKSKRQASQNSKRTEKANSSVILISNLFSNNTQTPRNH
jgi:hypothetical protein